MKKNIVIIFTILFSQTLLASSEIKDVYTYFGAGFGKNWLSTSIASDRGDKSGAGVKYNIFATYYDKRWMGSLGFGFYDLYLENKLTGTDYVKLITETFYLDLMPEYRLSNRFSVGLSYQLLIGEEYLAAPSTTINANNAKTSESLAGLVAHYDIPFKDFRIRTGISGHKILSVGSRSAYIAMLTLQFGTAVYDSEYDEEPKIIYREREVIKTITAEVIELGEQVINFKSGSYRLKEKSLTFVKKMAVLLSENLNSWQIVRIVGHTDVVGFKDKNQVLSERRAESVKNILIDSGLSRERVFFLGFGESRLKTHGVTVEDHRTNRRVEFQFVGHLNKDFANKFKELVAEETAN